MSPFGTKDSHGERRNIQENASSGWSCPSDDRGDGGPSAVSGSDGDTVVGRPASEAHQSTEVSAHATPEVSPSGGTGDIRMLAPRRANRRHAHPSENSRTLQAEARYEIIDLAKGVAFFIPSSRQIPGELFRAASRKRELACGYGQKTLEGITFLLDGFGNTFYHGSISDGTRNNGVQNH